MFSYEVLKRFQQVNQSAFSKLKTSVDHEFAGGRVLPAGATLLELVHMGMRQQSDAPAALSVLLSELGAQNEQVLLACCSVRRLTGLHLADGLFCWR